MILVKSFTVLVEPVQQTSTTILTAERPFIPPVQRVAGPGADQPTGVVTKPPVMSVTGTTSVQATGRAVSHSTSATQPADAAGARVAMQPVKAPGARPAISANQPVKGPVGIAAAQLVGAPSALPVFSPTSKTTASQDATGATVMLHGQFTSLVEQTVSSKKPSFAASLTCAVDSQAQDSDIDQVSEPTSPTQDTEEEGEVSDPESSKPDDCD